MSFAVAESFGPGYAISDDRSVSLAGSTLRASLRAAMEPPYDRGEEIYQRVVNALRSAEQEDGVLIAPEAFSRVLDLLEKLPREMPLPEVVVESENEVGMDWDEGATRVLSLTVRDTPVVGFAGLFGAEPVHGRVVFAEEVPETLRFFFGKLYPSIRRRL